ncbi:MAG: hypothetical protein ABIJ96_08730 [Elusimicrobiota bacterium]
MARIISLLAAIALLAWTLYCLPKLYNIMYRIDWLGEPDKPQRIIEEPIKVEPPVEPKKFKFFKNASETPPDKILKSHPAAQKTAP